MPESCSLAVHVGSDKSMATRAGSATAARVSRLPCRARQRPRGSEGQGWNGGWPCGQDERGKGGQTRGQGERRRWGLGGNGGCRLQRNLSAPCDVPAGRLPLCRCSGGMHGPNRDTGALRWAWMPTHMHGFMRRRHCPSFDVPQPLVGCSALIPHPRWSTHTSSALLAPPTPPTPAGLPPGRAGRVVERSGGPWPAWRTAWSARCSPSCPQPTGQKTSGGRPRGGGGARCGRNPKRSVCRRGSHRRARARARPPAGAPALPGPPGRGMVVAVGKGRGSSLYGRQTCHEPTPRFSLPAEGATSWAPAASPTTSASSG